MFLNATSILLNTFNSHKTYKTTVFFLKKYFLSTYSFTIVFLVSTYAKDTVKLMFVSSKDTISLIRVLRLFTYFHLNNSIFSKSLIFENILKNNINELEAKP